MEELLKKTKTIINLLEHSQNHKTVDFLKGMDQDKFDDLIVLYYMGQYKEFNFKKVKKEAKSYGHRVPEQMVGKGSFLTNLKWVMENYKKNNLIF